MSDIRMVMANCFYCGGKFYDHDYDRRWRLSNYKGDQAHIECWNTAAKQLPVGKAYDDFMAGIKSIQFNPLVRRDIKELDKL